MKTPSQILWEEAGEPAEYVDGIVELDDPQACAVCGGRMERGVDCYETFGENEDGYEHFASTSSDWICPGCHYLSMGRGSDQFRFSSIVWREDGGLRCISAFVSCCLIRGITHDTPITAWRRGRVRPSLSAAYI